MEDEWWYSCFWRSPLKVAQHSEGENLLRYLLILLLLYLSLLGVEMSQGNKMLDPVRCPLCRDSSDFLDLEQDHHIAQHLHSFALKAIPWEVTASMIR